jgi:oligoendopeptidase F
MSSSTLPDSAAAFADATWADLAPYYEALATRPLDHSNVEGWLADWSALDALLDEAEARAEVEYTVDTTDATKEARQLRFASEIGPQRGEQRVRLAGRLLDLGYERPGLETTVRHFRNSRKLFREENVALGADVQRLNAQYQKITGGMLAEWEGEQKPLPQLAPFLESQDRAVRERAFRLRAQPYIDAHDELAELFTQQYALRQQMAHNAGFANYRDYAHRQNDRFDYSPADCERFAAAVEETVAPAVARRQERRRRAMGLDTLRPWDLAPDPQGRPALKPFTEISGLIDPAVGIFTRLDPTLGGYFRTMVDEKLLDLDSRRGKAPGGYCTSFAHVGRPFIFMNAAGMSGDVNTLLHEAGHAFHDFAAQGQPLLFQRHTGSEMAEVASMSMELLTAPYLGRAQGGYYDDEEFRRNRIEHLESILIMLPHIASVDAFQQWIYTDKDGADPAARDAAWLRIRARFEPGVDWSGLEAQRVARWYQQLHIFLYPFYYIEYGIAQFGALQVWRNSLRDPQRALADYRHALSLGASQPLPDLFAAAGARLVFDAATMAELVALVEEQLSILEN